MTTLSKNKSLSIMAIIAMVIFFLLTFASLWNSLLTSEVKHEGWVIVFILLLFATGIFLFFIAYNVADGSKLEEMKKEAYELGKAEILREIETIRQEKTSDQKIESEEIKKIADTILSGMQGIRTEKGLCSKVLSNLAKELEFVQGIVFVKDKKGEVFSPVGEYAITNRKPQPFKIGENLTGQVAESKSMMTLYDIPEDYFVITSALGSAQPQALIIVPVLFGEECIAILELASFKRPDEMTHRILNQVSSELGIRLNKIFVA